MPLTTDKQMSKTKSPAFLFYSNDFTVGTQFFTDAQVGKYVRLMAAQHQHGHLSEKQMLIICGEKDAEIWAKFSTDADGKFFNERLDEEITKRNSYTESRRMSRAKADEDEVKIYLIKDTTTGAYKIGSSVNPERRFLEMCNQKNPAITVGERKYELVWFSNSTMRTDEKKLHEQFKEKRITGEWFNLSSDDINSICNKYTGTYVERMYQHTENENENENENSNLNQKDSKKFVKPTVQQVAEYFSEKQFPGTIQIEAEKFFDFYESKGWKVGKTGMKDWKSAIRNWIRNSNQNTNGQTYHNKQSTHNHQQQRADGVSELKQRATDIKNAIKGKTEQNIEPVVPE